MNLLVQLFHDKQISKDNLPFTFVKLFGVLQHRLFADVCSNGVPEVLLHPQAWHTREDVQRHQLTLEHLSGRRVAEVASPDEGMIARAEKQLSALVGRATSHSPEAKAHGPT